MRPESFIDRGTLPCAGNTDSEPRDNFKPGSTGLDVVGDRDAVSELLEDQILDKVSYVFVVKYLMKVLLCDLLYVLECILSSSVLLQEFLRIKETRG